MKLGLIALLAIRTVQNAAQALPPPNLLVKTETVPPTRADVPYGNQPRQVLDFWQAHSDRPTPLVFYVHGGGWQNQDKTDIDDHLNVRAFLDAGISVATVNYRFLEDADATHIAPPIQWPLHDAQRALQFLRTKASAWHLDTSRIGASGVSAGGGTVLWLALHPDMADLASSDPLARESTHFYCVGVKAPVVSLDPKQVREWIPNAVFGAHAFGFADLTRAASFQPFYDARETYLAEIRRYSPYEFASKDAPPIFIEFPNQDKPPVPGEPQTDPNHSAISGLMLKRKLATFGVSMELQYPGAPDSRHANMQAYLTEMLSRTAPSTK